MPNSVGYERSSCLIYSQLKSTVHREKLKIRNPSPSLKPTPYPLRSQVLIALLLWIPVNVALADDMARTNAHGVTEMLLDNDELAGINRRDRWYTSGYRFRKSVRRSSRSRSWERLAAWVCPGLGDDGATDSFDQWSVGQNIYTQSIRNRPAPLPNDRPIAALLYGTTGSALVAANGYASTTLEIGVVGPAALGWSSSLARGIRIVRWLDVGPRAYRVCFKYWS